MNPTQNNLVNLPNVNVVVDVPNETIIKIGFAFLLAILVGVMAQAALTKNK